MIFYKSYLVASCLLSSTLFGTHWVSVSDAKHIRGGGAEVMDEDESHAKLISSLKLLPGDHENELMASDSNTTLSWHETDYSQDIAETRELDPAPQGVKGIIRSMLVSNTKAVTVPGPVQGSNTYLWPFVGDSKQIFYYVWGYELMNLYGTNLCLDAYPNTPGQRVYLWRCHGGSSQKWSFDSGASRIVNGAGGCLDIWQSNPYDGASLVIWPCHDGMNQKWSWLARPY